jgi:ubiquinone/menaquinone biosynthesis C-methylase UbiE
MRNPSKDRRSGRIMNGRCSRFPDGRKAQRPEAIPDKRSRDLVVAAQYNSVEATERYAQSYEGWRTGARYFQSRIELVSQVLTSVPGGDLLDVGCGPGMMVRALLDSRPEDFRITAIDQSEAMIRACAQRAGGAASVRTIVARAESMPFTKDSFDVVLAMGVLEYSEISRCLTEIARVIRPGGLALITMLNPTSPYRYVEWHIYPVVQRVVGLAETVMGMPAERRHGPSESGIRALGERALRTMAARAGLRTVDAPAFDVTYVVPPIDRIVRRWARGWQRHPERTISRGWRKHLGSAYMLVSRKVN